MLNLFKGFYVSGEDKYVSGLYGSVFVGKQDSAFFPLGHIAGRKWLSGPSQEQHLHGVPGSHI